MPDEFFLIFGIIVSLIGLAVTLVKTRDLLKCKMKVEASVTGLKKESQIIRGSTVHTYRPKFSYTVDGKEYKDTAPFSTVRESKYRPGDSLTLFVSASDPKLYRFKGRNGLLFFGVAVLAVGLLFVVLYFV